MTRLGSGCSFGRLASTDCRLKPLPFEGFCFLLFEGFGFLLLESFDFHVDPKRHDNASLRVTTALYVRSARALPSPPIPQGTAPTMMTMAIV